MTIKSWPSPGRALLQLIESKQPGLVAGDPRLGGRLPGIVNDFYIFVDHVGGSSDQINGVFTFDLDAFATSYSTAESLAFDLEALVLGYPHVVAVGDRTVIFDSVEQNTGPAERPWSDDSVTRFGATYTMTARRR